MTDRRDDLTAAIGWYHRLLRIFPRAFRDRFAQDQTELFADLYVRTPAAQRTRFWIRIAADTAAHGIRERLTRQPRLRFHGDRRRGLVMTRLLEDLRD